MTMVLKAATTRSAALIRASLKPSSIKRWSSFASRRNIEQIPNTLVWAAVAAAVTSTTLAFNNQNNVSSLDSKRDASSNAVVLFPPVGAENNHDSHLSLASDKGNFQLVDHDMNNDQSSSSCPQKYTNASAHSNEVSNDSAEFQMLAKLEVKEEGQKIRLARFLREITELSREEQKSTLRRFATERHASLKTSTKVSPSVQWKDLSKEQVQGYLDSLRRGDLLEPHLVIDLLRTATEVLKKDETLVDLGKNVSLTVLGDLHGSLPCAFSVFDMVRDSIFQDKDEEDTSAPRRVLVATGDYIDRGEHSVEVFCTLILLKILYPDRVVLLRGNHEDVMISSVYGCHEEIRQKYKSHETAVADTIWEELGKVFGALPIAAKTDTALLLHGGLPSDNFNLEDLASISIETRCKIDTIVEPQNEQEQLLENILWSDPCVYEGITENPRGSGISFGPDVARDFLERHGLKYLIRGHEIAEHGAARLDCGDGYCVFTVFSTANYPNGEGTNLGAIVNVDEDGYCFPVQFEFAGNGSKAEKKPDYYEEAFRGCIAGNRKDLENAFGAIDTNKSGLVTKNQWVTVMAETLELSDVQWESLQESLAPASDGQNGEDAKINWKQFLNKYSSRFNPDLESLGEDQVSLLHQNKDKLLNLFKLLDTDGSGSIDLKEFTSGVELLNEKYLSSDKQISNAVELFHKIDLDGSGEIDIEEFSAAMSHSALLNNLTDSMSDEQMSVLQENHEMLLAAFHFLDTDHSGSIDRQEFERGIHLMNKRLPPRSQFTDPGELFDVLDIDGSGEIDIDEFNQIFQSI